MVVEEVQVEFGVVGLCQSVVTCGDLGGLRKNRHQPIPGYLRTLLN